MNKKERLKYYSNLPFYGFTEFKYHMKPLLEISYDKYWWYQQYGIFCQIKRYGVIK